MTAPNSATPDPATPDTADVPEHADNPFAPTSQAHGLTSGQQAVSLLTGLSMAGLIAGPGLAILWFGYQFYLATSAKIDPEQPFLKQLTLGQLAGLATVSTLLLGFAAFVGLGVKNNIERQMQRAQLLKQNRSELADQVEQMKEDLRTARQKADNAESATPTEDKPPA